MKDIVVEFTFPYNTKVREEGDIRKVYDVLLRTHSSIDDFEKNYTNWRKTAVEAKDLPEGGQLYEFCSWTNHKARFADIAKLKYPIHIGGYVCNSIPQDEITPSSFLPAPSPVLNTHAGINVAVAGLGLIQMRRVLLLANSCTDSLQAHLDIGWHILAICVQPDQRRPDYILGFHGALDAMGNPITGNPEVSSPAYPSTY